MKKLNRSLVLLLTTMMFFVFFSNCEINTDPPTPGQNVGDTLWVHQKPIVEQTTWISDLPMAIGIDGSVYYTAGGGNNTFEPIRVYAINKDDGSLKWKTEQLAGSHPGSNIVVGDDGVIYVLAYTKLYAIDPNSGVINWEWEVPETIIFEGNTVASYGTVSNLTLANNGDLILKTTGSGSYYRAMYCVNPQGTTNWYRVIGAVGTNITIGSNGVIFDYEYAGADKYIYAINPDNGSVFWRVSFNYADMANNNIAITDNGDVLCSLTDSLCLLNATTGEYIWKVLSQTNYKIKQIGTDGLVSVYDQWSGRHFYNIPDGAEAKIIESGAADPISFGNNGNYYRGASPGLVCYNAGWEEIWNFNSGGSAGWTLTISNDKIVYIVSGDKVFAIQGDSPLAQNGWPRVLHDNRNTNNYSKH